MKPSRSDSVARLIQLRKPHLEHFEPIDFPVPLLEWPTRSRLLFCDPVRYIARTRANPDYGKPGWTRDCGRRFHRGLDIAPLRAIPTGGTIEVRFSDCAAGTEYPSHEPGWIPDDDVFAVLDGIVVLCIADPEQSDLGIFAVIRHVIADRPFHTLYAHLADLRVDLGESVQAGRMLGRMGQTSRSVDARAWMGIAPHLHFEVIAQNGAAHDPLQFLKAGLAPRYA